MITKIVFKVEAIPNSFFSPVFPSLTFSQNMATNYFFSVPLAFVVMSMLELKRKLSNHH